MNLPLLLTGSRIVLILPFAMAFYFAPPWVSTAIFVVASLTDWLDGFLARRWQQTSALGAFLDPLADKLLVTTALILLVGRYPDSPWLMFCTLLIIHRELVVTGLRAHFSSPKHAAALTVSAWGKAKTALQMVALVSLLWTERGLFEWGLFLLISATLLTLISLIAYLKQLWH